MAQGKTKCPSANWETVYSFRFVKFGEWYIHRFFCNRWICSCSGFYSLGIVWLFSTILAFQYIRKGSYEIHKKLMTYSYASCFAAVTLRIWLPILTLVFDDFFIAYKIVAWLCWTPNIFVPYLINRQKGSS